MVLLLLLSLQSTRCPSQVAITDAKVEDIYFCVEQWRKALLLSWGCMPSPKPGERHPKKVFAPVGILSSQQTPLRCPHGRPMAALATTVGR